MAEETRPETSAEAPVATSGVRVSTKTITAGRDVVISATIPFERRPRDYRRLLQLALPIAAMAFLGIFLAVRLWPTAKEVPFRLDAETSLVRFRLAQAQRVFGRLPFVNLVAQDLDRLELPGEGGAGEIVEKDPEARRLGLALEGLVGPKSAGTITLEQTYLPRGSLVELSVGGNRELRLSLDSIGAEPLELSLSGPYRTRVLGSARQPGPWRKAIASSPERLTITPRAGRLDLVAEARASTGELELAPKIEVDGLWLYAIERLDDHGSTKLEEIFHLERGTLDVAALGEPVTFDRGSELRFEGARGVVSALRAGDKGFHMLVQGVATRIAWGPAGHQVELPNGNGALRRTIDDLSAGLALVTGVLTLVLRGVKALARARAGSSPGTATQKR